MIGEDLYKYHDRSTWTENFLFSSWKDSTILLIVYLWTHEKCFSFNVVNWCLVSSVCASLKNRESVFSVWVFVCVHKFVAIDTLYSTRIMIKIHPPRILNTTSDYSQITREKAYNTEYKKKLFKRNVLWLYGTSIKRGLIGIRYTCILLSTIVLFQQH